MNRLGTILRTARGSESRVQFARRLELSYTFVRALEHGQRFPSDPVLKRIAEVLRLDSAELLLAAYCDRSPSLAAVLTSRGLTIPAGVESTPESVPAPRGAPPVAPAPAVAPTQPAWQPAPAIRPF